MTEDEFLKEVSKIRSWKHRSGVPAIRRANGDCPLVAVQKRLHRTNYSWAPSRAAKNLSMSTHLAQEIAELADGHRPFKSAFAKRLKRALRV